jgi:hypothetical protein
MAHTSLHLRPEVDAFWGELQAGDHCVQFYESDAAFLNALEAFVASGIRQGDAVIIIGTARHRQDLEARLESNGLNVRAAVERDQFIALDAEATLKRFMVNHWPDERLFEQMVSELLGRARRQHRNVRAFGEMVALMWADGHCQATIRLEEMWSKLCQNEAFSLFCAFPKTGFAENITAEIAEICNCHSKVYVL